MKSLCIVSCLVAVIVFTVAGDVSAQSPSRGYYPRYPQTYRELQRGRKYHGYWYDMGYGYGGSRRYYQSYHYSGYRLDFGPAPIHYPNYGVYYRH